MTRRAAADSSNPDEVARLLRDRRVRKIGWGTGSCFRSSRRDIRLDYLVDGNSSMWGRTVEGLPVRPPDALAEEDPERTIVVIYSQFYSEIVPALQAFGAFHYGTIYAIDGHERLTRTLSTVAERAAHARPRRPARRRNAFVMQGPVTADFTISLARCLRLLNPDAHLILSTWDDTDPAMLTRIEPEVDVLVTGSHPADPGPQNVNRQIVSTQRGLAAARALKAERVMKVRTDAAPLARGIFPAAARALDLYPADAARRHGLRGRIMVPETFTRKFLPYHPSDIVLCGHIDDLEQYYAAPLSTRRFSPADREWRPKRVLDLSREELFAETMLALAFARTVGWRLKHSLEDGWAFLRDVFVVQDNNWLQLFWAKQPVLAPLAGETPLQECLSHYTWQQFVWRTTSFATEMAAFRGRRPLAETSWKEFYGPKG